MKGKTSDDKDEEGDNAGPPGEAMVSMIICMIILTIFFIFFCLVPVYRWDTENWNIVNQHEEEWTTVFKKTPVRIIKEMAICVCKNFSHSI